MVPKAVEFYKSAFGAIETYRLEDRDGNAVVKFSVNAVEFWLSDEYALFLASDKIFRVTILFEE